MMRSPMKNLPKELAKIAVSDGMRRTALACAARHGIVSIPDGVLDDLYITMQSQMLRESAAASTASKLKDAIIKFEEKIMPIPFSGCWVWMGAMANKTGYGKCWNGVDHEGAHRFSYRVHKGPIPDEFVIDHMCRVRLCVNPDHLRAVTQHENVMCGEGAAAKNARRTHCTSGHSLADAYEKYDYRSDDGRKTRHCKTCANEGALGRYYAKKKRDALKCESI